MAIPRPYQDESVGKARAHLVKRRSATLVLPTGAGKTNIAAFFIRRILDEQPDATFLFVQHTEELLDQNMRTIARVAGVDCSIVMAGRNDWNGRVVFASVPTISKSSRLVEMKAFSHMIIDECHHSAAETWVRVIDKARRRNPKLRILGLSATPDRGDGRPLPKTLGDIVHRIHIQELIDLGHLVPPRAYSVVMGDSVERISRLKAKDAGSGDQSLVAEILDTPLYNEAVVAQWKARAEGRPTVAFCSTIEHARHVAEAFEAAGVPARAIDYADKEGRRQAIEDFKAGRIRVLTNCLLLTEGFDHQPTGCVIVLRAMLHASSFVQALGRALRVVDAEIHPGVIKRDAICLDFSGAAVRHAELDRMTQLPREEIDLHDLAANDDRPVAIDEVLVEDDDEPSTFVPVMEEVDLAISQFRWTDIHRDGRTILVSGLCGYAAMCPIADGWIAFGRTWEGSTKILHCGARQTAFAAGSDWIRSIEPDDRAVGNRRWLDHPISDRQHRMLRAKGYREEDLVGMSKYEASCHIVYINERKAVIETIRAYIDLSRQLRAA